MIRYNHTENEEFVNQLRKRVRKHFTDTRSTPYATPGAYLKASVLLLLYIFCYGAILRVAEYQDFILLFAILGALKIFIALNVAHDAAHFAFAKSRIVNQVLLFVFDVLGANGYMWKLRHVHSHHAYANVPGYDADIRQSDLVRIFPDSPFRRFHRFQHFYMPVLYGFYSLHWLLFRDFKDFFQTPVSSKGTKTHQPGELLRLVVGKGLYLFIMIGLPMLLSPFSLIYILTGFLVMQVSASYTVAMALASAHVGGDAEFPAPDNSGLLPYSYVMHQIITTTDFATNSALVTHLYGGFNHHVIHHLFPNICHIHYPKLTPILKATCLEYGIPYRENKTLLDSVRAHYNLLRKRSRQLQTVSFPEF